MEKMIYSTLDIELDSLAMERETLNNEIKEIKKKLDRVNKEIIEKLDKAEDYKTENYHFVHKIVYVAEHVVKESISQPLKVYGK